MPGIEWTAAPDAAFFLTIHEDGSIESDDFENLVTVQITGKMEACNWEGVAELSADISGLCAGGIALLEITERWEANSATLTCPGPVSQSVNFLEMSGPAGPEVRFDFMLTEEGDTQIFTQNVAGSSVYYSWTLHEYGLALVPLVPTPQD